MSGENEILLIEKRGVVDWVTLNRPDRLNALSEEMIQLLRDYFESKYRDDETRIIVLKANGRAFCAGIDLKETNTSGGFSVESAMKGQSRIQDIYKAMRRCPQPIISLVRGAACGSGMSLALASDIRVLGESAKLNAAYLTIGTTGCDMGASYFLPRLVGLSLASELLLTGRFIHAEEALQRGLAARVVPDSELEVGADSLIEHMIATTAFGLSMTKDALNFAIDAPSMEAAMALEDRQQILAVMTGEMAERQKKFRN